MNNHTALAESSILSRTQHHLPVAHSCETPVLDPSHRPDQAARHRSSTQGQHCLRTVAGSSGATGPRVRACRVLATGRLPATDNSANCPIKTARRPDSASREHDTNKFDPEFTCISSHAPCGATMPLAVVDCLLCADFECHKCVTNKYSPWS